MIDQPTAEQALKELEGSREGRLQLGDRLRPRLHQSRLTDIPYRREEAAPRRGPLRFRGGDWT